MDLSVEELYNKLYKDSNFSENIIDHQEKFFEMVKEKDEKAYENIMISLKIRFSLSKESDRGCVLLSVSYLEDALGKYILSYLKGNNTFKKKILNYNLSNFSSRINFAFSIGLINEKLMNDLNIIRNIRNEFAHSFEIIDFNSSVVNNHIKNLNYNFRKKNEVSNRSQFTTYIFAFLGVIMPYQNKSLDIKDPIDLEQVFINVHQMMKQNVNKFSSPKEL